jgi:ABC-2 type transport system permease protein
VLEVTWSAERACLLLLAIAGGVCLFVGLVVLQATSAFWTTESLEVWNAFTYGGVLMSQYPIVIYRPWFRQFFTYVIPLACVSYFPVIAVLQRNDPLGTPEVFHWLAPFAGVVFLSVSLQVWKFGVKRYRSTGS